MCRKKKLSIPIRTCSAPMPALGFFVRHVQGIEMEGIKIIAGNRDERPAFVLEDVENADFTRPQAPVPAEVPLFVLSDVENFRLRGDAIFPTRVLTGFAVGNPPGVNLSDQPPVPKGVERRGITIGSCGFLVVGNE